MSVDVASNRTSAATERRRGACDQRKPNHLEQLVKGLTVRVDIVRELIQRMLDAASREGTLTESIALEIERRFRMDYAGSEYYVKKMNFRGLSARNQIVHDYLAGKSEKQIAAETGLSRATIYRNLKK
jgi:DNA-binding NarL/FixJ family response regulator